MPRRASEVTRRLKRRDNYRLCENGSLGGRGPRHKQRALRVPLGSPCAACSTPASSHRLGSAVPSPRPKPPVCGTRGRPGQGAGPTEGPMGCSTGRPHKGGEEAQSSTRSQPSAPSLVPEVAHEGWKGTGLASGCSLFRKRLHLQHYGKEEVKPG